MGGKRNAVPGGRLSRLAACALLTCVASTGWTQKPVAAESDDKDQDRAADVVVRGTRGSAVADIAPIASFDEKFIEGTGATSMGELLRVLLPMARSADGSDPILLLNGQRTSGWDEIGSLPTEALAGSEILPEAAAIKYGYPPTRRLINFMTKPRFRSIDLSTYAGGSTAGGAGSWGANGALTRIANKKRLSLALDYTHTDPLRSSRRPIALDPDNKFDPAGNLIAASGGEIDPALSAAAGRPILATGVPADPQGRTSPAAYLAMAGRLNQFDVLPYSTLIDRNDVIKGSAVLKNPLAQGIDATLTLTAERNWGLSLNGLPPITIFVPASNPYAPFGKDLLLFRYANQHIERQHSAGTTLHAGLVVQGGIGGWQWDLTSTLDQSDKISHGDRGYDPRVIDQAAANGANPFGELDAAMLGPHLSQSGRTINRKAEAKAVARGMLAHLPAGELSLVTTAEGGWSDAHTRSRGFIDSDIRVNQSRVEGAVTLDLPLTSRREKVLPFLGDLSVNATARLRDVKDYGQLHDTTLGLAWAPIKNLQFTVTRNATQSAPNIDFRSAPTVQALNVPFFDFGTGRSAYVTLIMGGNPDLAPERRRVQSYAFTLKPFEKVEFRLTGTYSQTLIRDGSGMVSALTPEAQAQLPEQFVRDPLGRLDTVILRPFNFYRQRQRALSLQLNFYGQIGTAQPTASGKPARSGGSFYLGVAPNLSLDDRLELKPGMPAFDLLHGDTVDGSQWHYRLAIWGWGGIARAGDGVSFTWQYFGPSRIRGGSAPTDLRFGSRFNLDLSAFVYLRHWWPKAQWLKKTKLTLQVVNPFDSYTHVRDGNGNTPFRYQRAFSDPQGRTFKITVRKLFQ